MNEYHKIQTLWLRNPENKHRTLLEGQWAKPEFEYLAENGWLFTEKVDGTNIRVMWDGERVTLGGKTDNAQIPAFLVTRLMERFTPESFGWCIDSSACLYGEGYGAKIQKGGGNYIPDGQDFILFDIKIGDWWLKREDVVGIGETMDCKVVPVVGEGTLHEAIDAVRDGFASRISHTNIGAEGLVVRPLVDLYARNGERIIGKIKHRDFTR